QHEWQECEEAGPCGAIENADGRQRDKSPPPNGFVKMQPIRVIIVSGFAGRTIASWGERDEQHESDRQAERTHGNGAGMPAEPRDQYGEQAGDGHLAQIAGEVVRAEYRAPRSPIVGLRYHGGSERMLDARPDAAKNKKKSKKQRCRRPMKGDDRAGGQQRAADERKPFAPALSQPPRRHLADRHRSGIESP